jgi:hypothetical protein
MRITLPMPRIQSERFEYGQRHHYKRGTDNPRRNRFYTSLFHTGYKNSFFPLNSQTIHHISSIYHISVLFIPEIWWD